MSTKSKLMQKDRVVHLSPTLSLSLSHSHSHSLALSSAYAHTHTDIYITLKRTYIFGWKIRVVHILSSTELKLSHLFLHHRPIFTLARTQKQTHATSTHIYYNNIIKLYARLYARTHAYTLLFSSRPTPISHASTTWKNISPKQF